jgi:hypothetical protein
MGSKRGGDGVGSMVEEWMEEKYRAKSETLSWGEKAYFCCEVPRIRSFVRVDVKTL